jgi:hypothetical protein
MWLATYNVIFILIMRTERNTFSRAGTSDYHLSLIQVLTSACFEDRRTAYELI